jgi:hypothetical protein
MIPSPGAEQLTARLMSTSPTVAHKWGHWRASNQAINRKRLMHQLGTVDVDTFTA